MFKIKSLLVKDAFCYSQTNRSAFKTIISVTIAIILALLLSVIIGAAAGYNPGKLLSNLFTMGFNDYKSLIVNITVLGIGGLSFIFAFKTGLFNIGITGQMISAGIVCLAISIGLKNVNFPNGISQIFMIIMSILISSIIGGLIGVLKVYLKVNEVISSILLNWILFFSIRIIIEKYFNADPGNPLTSSVAFTQVFTLNANGFGWLAALIIFIILIVGVYVTLKYTVFGIKITSVGKSISASKYLGYNTRILSISSLSISAAIAGILGYVLYTANADASIPMSSAADILPAEGANGIAIGLISMSNPFATIPVSIIIGLFQTSSQFLETGATQISNLIIGFVILGAALFSLFYNLKPWIKIQEWRIGKQFATHYKTYLNDLDKLISKYKSKVFDVSKYFKYYNNPEKLNKYLDKKTIDQFEAKIETLNDNNLSMKEIQDKYIQELYLAYKKEKNHIIAQFKKHNLIDKASKTFWYKLSIEKKKENYINELTIEYKRLVNKTNNKIELYEQKLININNNKKEAIIAEKINDLKTKLNKLEADYQKQLKHQNEIFDKQMQGKHITLSKANHCLNQSLKELKRIKNLDEKETELVNKWIHDSYDNLISQLGYQKEGA